MYIILLRFSENKGLASDHMDGHRAWLKQGFATGMFLLAGTLKPGIGGGILAVADSLNAVSEFVDQDPFVVANVVTAEILEMEPARADKRLNFLLT
ncbi:YciI family protein [Ruegeria arenilitoris]|uniref:YciI family protein n=1 Tax=Ruegeria arenilitoris TaxID=1173585 RepID=UPI0014800E2E|nr:YciI family protein [Ruegeria arenilitoris]